MLDRMNEMMFDAMDRFIDYKCSGVITVALLVWTFDAYWVSVSGWDLVRGPKIALLVLPILIPMLYAIYKRIKHNIEMSRRRKFIMLRHRIARFILETM